MNRPALVLLAALPLLGPAASAHEGDSLRIARASSRRTTEGGVALDVLCTLSLARTPSLLVIAQFDFNRDGRFDALEGALAERALGSRADGGFEVLISGTPREPTRREVAVQVDARQGHVEVAVLLTWETSAPADFEARFNGPGVALPFTLASPAVSTMLPAQGIGHRFTLPAPGVVAP